MVSLRTSGQGYSAPDTNRQKYGLTQRDDVSGLDHTWWRKYESLSGRWTSPDPYNGSLTIANPQSFNRYTYVRNDPANYIDPSGLLMVCFYSIVHVRVGDWGHDELRFDGCIDFGGFYGGSGFNDRPRGGGSGPRRFQHAQKKLTPQQEQQKGFDDCAKNAIRTFRRSEYKAIGKIAVGTVGTTLAAVVGPEALAANAAARSVPVGVRIVSFSARYKLGNILGYGSTVLGVFTGQLILNGFQDSKQNNALVDQKIAECAAKFPQANHSTWRTFLTTY